MIKESKVNVYGTQLGRVLKSASGSYVRDLDENQYFDLFSSAGVCNFGHNHPVLKSKMIRYLEQDGLVHGLDYYTQSKLRFIELMETRILPPSVQNQYRYYFSPPAGTLAIEAAIKYARQNTGRRELACFSNGFHGLSYHALSITGNILKRRASYSDLESVVRLPYEGYYGPDFDYLGLYHQLLEDGSSGCGLPAAVVFEMIQAEGGCHTATKQWYQGLLSLCQESGIVSIVDEIQAGCGRTGDYFSFARFSGLWPDIICLSKSLSGMGVPLSLVMIRKELDGLASGENSGTFRGNSLGVESAANTIELFTDPVFQETLEANQKIMSQFVGHLVTELGLCVKGRGMLRGIVFEDSFTARTIVSKLKELRILVETCGGAAQTIKVMPPLTSIPHELEGVLKTVFQVIRKDIKER